MKHSRLIAAVASWTLLAFPITAAPAHAEFTMMGPGNRIHGADISRWNHPSDKAINFAKMSRAGVHFVMIKASDTRDDADKLARKYIYTDRKGAQAAGIYTGFYHYAVLPDVTTAQEIIEDAQSQAKKVIWRLTSLGGYNELDLPYALDLENNCVKVRSNKSCVRRASRTAVTLWAKTFLASVKEVTGRTPIIYSYPTFLESAMARDSELRQYPLWIAQYAIDPAKEGAAPSKKAVGCYVHSWTTSQCTAQWIVWQYTSCGIAAKYGVPGNRLDLNVFHGDSESFKALATGVWQPRVADLLPHLETSTTTMLSQSASTTDKYVTFTVDVTRPDGSPVVTGDVKFISGPNPVKMTFVQSVVRQTSGSWKIALSQVPAGVWNGRIAFSDLSETHANSEVRVSFTVEQGPTPTPQPSPTKKPVAKPVSDGCRYQIKN